MTLEELAHIMGTKIEVVYCHDQRRFTAKLTPVVVLSEPRGLVRGEVGGGRTPDEALHDYAGKIAGRTIRVGDLMPRNAADPSRPPEYAVPATLRHEPSASPPAGATPGEGARDAR